MFAVKLPGNIKLLCAKFVCTGLVNRFCFRVVALLPLSYLSVNTIRKCSELEVVVTVLKLMIPKTRLQGQE